MSAKLEDLVNILKNTSSPFGLAGELPEFAQGLADAASRLQAVEKAVKALQHSIGNTSISGNTGITGGINPRLTTTTKE